MKGFIMKRVSPDRDRNARELIREGGRLAERQEEECRIHPEALREAARVGIADIEAGRFRAFNAPGSLRQYLAALAETVLADSEAS